MFEPVKDFISRPWRIWEIKLRSAKNKTVECRQQESIVTQLLVWSQKPELHMDLADLIIYPLTQVEFSIGTDDGCFANTDKSKGLNCLLDGIDNANVPHRDQI